MEGIGRNSGRAAAVLLGVVMLGGPAVAWACCPSDGTGVARSTGLGMQFPVAEDLAIDSAWQVYEFQRDGVRYLQINDRAGGVRAAIAYVSDTFWVLPVGTDPDRVSTPDKPRALPTGVTGRVIYRSAAAEVLAFTGSDGITFFSVSSTSR